MPAFPPSIVPPPSGLRTDVHRRQFIAARVVRIRQGRASCILKIYDGVLVHQPMIGMPLMLLTEDGRQLVTTVVVEIQDGDGSMRVKTKNSEYRVEFVMVGPALHPRA